MDRVTRLRCTASPTRGRRSGGARTPPSRTGSMRWSARPTSSTGRATEFGKCATQQKNKAGKYIRFIFIYLLCGFYTVI
jgi:hypothetical protein